MSARSGVGSDRQAGHAVLVLVAAAVVACSSVAAPTGSMPTATRSSAAAPTQSTAGATAHPSTRPTAVVTHEPTATRVGEPTSSASPASPSPAAPPLTGEGLGWSRVALPTGKTDGSVSGLDVAAGDDGWLAAGYVEPLEPDTYAAPVFWWSSDGLTWTPMVDAEWPGGRLDQLTYWNGRFWAGGMLGSGQGAHAVFWHSEDGRSWTQIKDSAELAFFSGPPEDWQPGYLADMWVEGGALRAAGGLTMQGKGDSPERFTLWRTDDGERWLRERRDHGMNWQTPVSADGSQLRLDSDGLGIERSADGGDWEYAWPEGGFRDLWLRRLRPVPSGYLALGNTEEYAPTAVYSVDGLTWEESTGWPTLQGSGWMGDVDAKDGLIIAIGQFDGGPVLWVNPPQQT